MVANGGWHCKELIRGAVVSVAAAACFFAAFVAAALWLPQDQQAIRRHIVAAVLDGTFNGRPSYGPFGSTVFARHTLDCTLAGMMLAPPAGRLAEAIGNRHVAFKQSWSDPRVPATTDCQGLARAIPELGTGYGDVRYQSSDRYILGVRVVGRVLLSLMSFDAMARTLRGIAFVLLGGVGGLALWRLRTAPDAAARRFAAGYLVIVACLALLYGVHYFDATLYFAPPDHVHFTFIAISLLAPLARMRPAGLAFYAASYGSLIAIFESLTGGIPFALALLPLLLALGFADSRRDYVMRLLLLWGAFCVAVVTCFALKKLIAIAFLGDQESFTSLLFYRMLGAPLPESGTRLTLGYLLASYRRWSSLIGLGSPNLGTAIVLASLALFAVESWRTRNRQTPSYILLACWLGVAMLLVWAGAFLNHTAVHPYFMARLLVIPVTGATILVMDRFSPIGPKPDNGSRRPAG
ncbi:MAG: hypothetical protein WDO17_00860 [Alphaproteobacteria bacterium]